MIGQRKEWMNSMVIPYRQGNSEKIRGILDHKDISVLQNDNNLILNVKSGEATELCPWNQVYWL